MFKYIKKIDYPNNDIRTVEQKINDLKKYGINVCVRDKNSKYKKGYILGITK